MYRRIIVMGMALVMLFSFVMFGASSCEIYNPQVTELLRRVEEMESRIRDKEERIAELERELEEENRLLRLELTRVRAILSLQQYLDTFNKRGFSVNNRGRVQAYFEAGTKSIEQAESIEAVNEALEQAKENMDSVPFVVLNFVFRIVEESIIVNYGENFRVNVEFINQLGRTVRLYPITWFEVYIMSGHSEFLNGRSTKKNHDGYRYLNGYRYLKNNEVLRNLNPLGDDSGIEIHNTLNRGMHALIFRFSYGAECLDQIFWTNSSSHWSNVIMLIVR